MECGSWFSSVLGTDWVVVEGLGLLRFVVTVAEEVVANYVGGVEAVFYGFDLVFVGLFHLGVVLHLNFFRL